MASQRHRDQPPSSGSRVAKGRDAQRVRRLLTLYGGRPIRRHHVQPRARTCTFAPGISPTGAKITEAGRNAYHSRAELQQPQSPRLRRVLDALGPAAPSVSFHAIHIDPSAEIHRVPRGADVLLRSGTGRARCARKPAQIAELRPAAPPSEGAWVTVTHGI